MLPLIPAIITGVITTALGKKIYDAVKESSSSSSSSDNSAERAREARRAEAQRNKKEREKRQFLQLQQTLHAELQELRKEYLSKSVTVTAPSKARIQRFKDFEIDQPAAAKAALGQLLDVSVQLKKLPNQIAANKKQLRELDKLAELVRAL